MSPRTAEETLKAIRESIHRVESDIGEGAEVAVEIGGVQLRSWFKDTDKAADKVVARLRRALAGSVSTSAPKETE